MEGDWSSVQQEAGSMASSMDGSSGDWRSQLQPESRQLIVNKIAETLKRHLLINVPEGFNELRKIAIRFEGKIYTAATSQSDYLRKISLKMLTMEKKTQQSAPINPSIPNTGAVNQNIADPGIQYELVTLSYPKLPTQWLHTPANRSVVDRDSNSILEDEPSAKQRKPNEPEKISPEEPSSCREKQKEPTFSCPICMCEIVSPFTTLCGHIFCEVCIKTAIKKQKKLCPTCRTKLTGKNNIHRVFLPSLD